jgi:hypothetical protein
MEVDRIQMGDQLPSTDPARVQDLRKIGHIFNKENNSLKK